MKKKHMFTVEIQIRDICFAIGQKKKELGRKPISGS